MEKKDVEVELNKQEINPVQQLYECFLIPELVFPILSNLRTCDLLSARCVSKLWRQVGDELLVKHHSTNILARIGVPPLNVEAFLEASNSSFSSSFFQKLKHFIFDGNATNFEDDKEHFESFLKKYFQQIKDIKFIDDPHNSQAQFEALQRYMRSGREESSISRLVGAGCVTYFGASYITYGCCSADEQRKFGVMKISYQ